MTAAMPDTQQAEPTRPGERIDTARPAERVDAARPAEQVESDQHAAAEEQHPPMSAAERLAESRERLRQWMERGDGRHEARRRTAAAEAEGVAPSAWDRLRGLPVIGVVIDAASAWWSNHPLQPAASLAQGVVRDSVGPLARRRPLMMVAAAFAIGGALVWLRPWRWLVRPALFAGLVSQIATRALTQMPWESMLGAFTSFAHARMDAEPHDEDLASDAEPSDEPSTRPTAAREPAAS
jgi:hypothetical protein